MRTGSHTGERNELQGLVDDLYRVGPSREVTKVEVELQAEVLDLGDELTEVVRLLPSGSYRRARLCDQINSIVTAHGWALVYGTVE